MLTKPVPVKIAAVAAAEAAVVVAAMVEIVAAVAADAAAAAVMVVVAEVAVVATTARHVGNRELIHLGECSIFCCTPIQIQSGEFAGGRVSASVDYRAVAFVSYGSQREGGKAHLCRWRSG